MGSLTSGPKAPTQQPQVIYVPQPVNNTSVATTTEPSVSQEQAEEASSEVRKQNLLGRERSRFGTIQTSFRGLLGLAEAAPARKTLLGE